ncbi:MAG: flagellar M-ring protein FliF [Nitrosomonadales bacterium]|nr:flagellar M-ring protein FliF [Nitrosomonadales bacterium]
MADDNPTLAPAQPPTVASVLAGLSSKQKMGLAVAVAATIALFLGMWMWGQPPEYRVLYSNLSDRDGGAIIDSLQQQNIPYKFSEGGGALLVPADKVHEVRLRLASQGLPKGSLAGFELMENQKFGTSQFLEQVNYQRALEGELARSMQTLAAVQAARVHLAIPKPTVFVKEQQKPSASVVLTLYPGRVLDRGQINGIVHLVSSSIPDMPASNVTILDQSGSLLSPTKEGPEGLDASQIKYVRQIEQDFVKRIESILAPLVGAENVHAQITADIDFSQSEQTAESFKPNQPPNEAAVRSQQSLESRNGAQNAAGVPGGLTNQPPVPATAPIVNPASAVAQASGSDINMRKESTTNFEVDRTIRYTKLPVGNIRRLSAAVLVNNRTVTDKSGKTSSRPLTDGEKEQITALVKDAMGFDAARGDSLNVLNSAFNEEKEAQGPEVPLWKQPETVALAKDGARYLLILGIALYLLLGVIRPAIKRAFPPPEPKVEEAEVHDEEAGASGAEHAEHPYDANLKAAKQMAHDDPKIVASVVKEWVNKDE